MNTTLAEIVTQHYGIALCSPAQSVARGFLSRNFVLESAANQYFLKQYRFTQLENVAAVHEAKFFFAAAGVPVILPIKTQSGASFFEFEQRYYALFPYIEGRQLKRGSFPAKALETSAAVLGLIHRSGKNASVSHVKARPAVSNPSHFDETSQFILAKIAESPMTEFDQLALATIQSKLKLVEHHRNEFSKIDLLSDHLVHGDYQDTNLFFDAADRVSHVFDWELTRVIHRGLELVRAIEFICFANPENFKAVFSAENYEKARCFLQHYHDFYPIQRSEFETVWRARYFDKLLSLWVEEEHYLANNPRVDPFLEAEYHTLHYYSQHLNEHIERLSEGILR
ncbi:MAG: aminoglycoside phosphotransferase family protein [Caldilineaceae bacterium]